MRSVVGREIPLRSYEALRRGQPVNDLLLKRVLYGISCRNYEAAAEAVPGAIGLSSSTVSREFHPSQCGDAAGVPGAGPVREDVVALVPGRQDLRRGDDGHRSRHHDFRGQTVGFVETDTETAQILTPFLRSLVDRGLDARKGCW